MARTKWRKHARIVESASAALSRNRKAQDPLAPSDPVRSPSVDANVGADEEEAEAQEQDSVLTMRSELMSEEERRMHPAFQR